MNVLQAKLKGPGVTFNYKFKGNPIIKTINYYFLLLPNLQRHDPLLSQVDPLLERPLLPAEHIQVRPVPARLDIVQIQTLLEQLRGSPRRRDHHIMVRLVPKVIS